MLGLAARGARATQRPQSVGLRDAVRAVGWNPSVSRLCKIEAGCVLVRVTALCVRMSDGTIRLLLWFRR